MDNQKIHKLLLIENWTFTEMSSTSMDPTDFINCIAANSAFIFVGITSEPEQGAIGKLLILKIEN